MLHLQLVRDKIQVVKRNWNMKKQIFVIFNFNKGIFTHILLNVFDLIEKGYEAGIILESEATKFITEYEEKEYNKWEKLKSEKLIFAVCEVCAKATGAFESAQRQGLPIDGRLSGHPPLEDWITKGYHIMLI
jgi:intracellular sulfur oxidation DsrE/DsrF family protein